MNNTYTLFWIDGKKELIQGPTIREALKLNNYSPSAQTGIAFHSDGDIRGSYTFINGVWVLT